MNWRIQLRVMHYQKLPKIVQSDIFKLDANAGGML